MLSLEPFSKDQGRSAVQPVRDPTNQLPCALRVYSPVDSHTCQTPWSVFQDGPNGELAGRCQERVGARGTPLGRNLPPDLGCIPKQPDSQTVPRDATGSGHDGAFTLSGAPFQGTWARSSAEDASPDYNSNVEDARFSSWALPGSVSLIRLTTYAQRELEVYLTTERHSVHRRRLIFRPTAGCSTHGRPISAQGQVHPSLSRTRVWRGQRCVTPRQACPRPNGLGRNLRSKTRWFTGFCNSYQVSHFATFFIDARAEISVAESRFK
ncbi:hypothetical protein LWI28_008293 [Acer negundo]|uniref:Uncharacterized protein n=1 Tax=Acer negundo TaxID=4023 RepID=A0AAD5NU18_ACENE|nr:hypothetical protein LWI28_008293 [Acer negundo]